MYGVDDPIEAPRIVEFYDRGTASHFETALIDVFIKADATMRARLRSVFPVLYYALARRYGWDRL